jgi:hypothetical protein
MFHRCKEGVEGRKPSQFKTHGTDAHRDVV